MFPSNYLPYIELYGNLQGFTQQKQTLLWTAMSRKTDYCLTTNETSFCTHYDLLCSSLLINSVCLSEIVRMWAVIVKPYSYCAKLLWMYIVLEIMFLSIYTWIRNFSVCKVYIAIRTILKQYWLVIFFFIMMDIRKDCVILK